MKLPSYRFCEGDVVCVPVTLFLSLPLLFTLVAASISHFLNVTIKFSCFSSDEIHLLCFLTLLALAISTLSMSGVVTKILSKNNNKKNSSLEAVNSSSYG